MRRGRFELEADAQSGRYYLMAIHTGGQRRSGWGVGPGELPGLRKLIEWAEAREARALAARAKATFLRVMRQSRDELKRSRKTRGGR